METVFQELWMAVINYQTGAVNLRRITEPLFSPVNGEELSRQFYAEFDAAEAAQQNRIVAAMDSAGLEPPARDTQEEPEPTPPEDEPIIPPPLEPAEPPVIDAIEPPVIDAIEPPVIDAIEPSNETPTE